MGAETPETATASGESFTLANAKGAHRGIGALHSTLNRSFFATNLLPTLTGQLRPTPGHADRSVLTTVTKQPIMRRAG